MIYHVATPDEWSSAQAAGDYRFSTRGLSLDDVGYIHCSRLEQVPGVLEAFYAGAGPLLLLSVDESRLTAEWRDDEIAPGVFFPHVYGPIDLDAIVAVTPIGLADDGSYEVPAV